MIRTRQILSGLILTAICLWLTGCWDAIELADRLYALSITIETVDKEADTTSSKDLYLGPDNRFLFTFEMPIAKEIGVAGPSPSGGGGGGGGQQKPTWDIPIKAASVTAAINKIQTQEHRKLDFSQLKVICIEEDIARKGIGSILEYFDRSTAASGVRVAVFKENDRTPFLAPIPRIDKVTGLDLEKLLKNRYTTAKVDMYVEKLVANYLNNYGFLVPTVLALKDRYDIGGAAIFCRDRMVGKLKEDEVNSLSFITEIPGREYLEILEVSGKNCVTSLQVERKKLKKSHSFKSGKLHFEYNLSIWGELLDFAGDPAKDIPELEKDFERYLEYSLNRLVKQAQKIPTCEYLGMGDYISKHDPKLWSRIEKTWPEVFKDAEIKVHVDKIAITTVGERMDSGPKK